MLQSAFLRQLDSQWVAEKNAQCNRALNIILSLEMKFSHVIYTS